MRAQIVHKFFWLRQLTNTNRPNSLSTNLPFCNEMTFARPKVSRRKCAVPINWPHSEYFCVSDTCQRHYSVSSRDREKKAMNSANSYPCWMEIQYGIGWIILFILTSLGVVHEYNHHFPANKQKRKKVEKRFFFCIKKLLHPCENKLLNQFSYLAIVVRLFCR